MDDNDVTFEDLSAYDNPENGVHPLKILFNPDLL
jgi:hypothetical protein